MLNISVHSFRKNDCYSFNYILLPSKGLISMDINSNNRTQAAAGHVGSGELLPARFEALL